MATFNYELSKQKKKNCKYSICLMIRNGKSNTPFTLPIEVLKSDWNANSQRIILRQKDDFDTRTYKEEANDTLAKLMSRVHEVERHLQKLGILNEMPAPKIKEAILNYDPKRAISGNGDFVQYWQMVAERKPKSANRYRYGLDWLIKYSIESIGTDSICFKNITSDFVAGFLSWMKEGEYIPKHIQRQNKIQYAKHSPATVKTYAAAFKSVLNSAIDANYLSADVLRGFRSFNPQVFHKPPYTLSIDLLRKMLHFSFPTVGQQMARDLFILSFCFYGMNLTDIFHLRSSDIVIDEDKINLHYIRSKTQKPICVEVRSAIEPIKQIMAKYAYGSNIWGIKDKAPSFYFALPSNYIVYDTFRSNLQSDIRKIRELLNFSKGFTFYTARDSWSTILSQEYQLGQENIDVGLGHSVSRSIASTHYIAVDVGKIAEAHADMLRRLFEE